VARKERYLVGLDVGTSKISAIVGEMTGEGGLDIIGIGLADSRGIRRDAEKKNPRPCESELAERTLTSVAEGLSVRVVRFASIGNETKPMMQRHP